MICPHRKNCGVKFQKKSGLVHISGKTVRRAEYMKQLTKPEYRNLTRKRNAVEAIPSVLRRKYRIDNMPVRGYVRTKCWYYLKIGALNVKRVLAWASTKAFSSTIGFVFDETVPKFLQTCQRGQIWKFS